MKLGIVLNVQGIQRWYNGGFRAAPSWYSNHAGFYQGLTVIGYVAATSCSCGGALMLKLLRWRPDLTDPHQILALLAVTTALGYLAFHTLLWEVEPRYGQAILPLLWVALAAIPRQARQSRPRWANQASLLNSATALLVAFGAAGVLGAQMPQKQVIAAQRSQLSVQYHAKPKTVTPGTVLAEVVDVNAPANYFSVQIHAGSQVQVTLTTLATGQTLSVNDGWQCGPPAPPARRWEISDYRSKPHHPRPAGRCDPHLPLSARCSPANGERPIAAHHLVDLYLHAALRKEPFLWKNQSLPFTANTVQPCAT